MEITKMAKLYKISRDSQTEKADMLIDDMQFADSFFARAKGLLGRQGLNVNQALWIRPCNNIHTFFMKFSIDCVFLNKNNRIEKVFTEIKPFRIIGPVWKAHSVIEFSEGFVKEKGLKPGDQLHVVN